MSVPGAALNRQKANPLAPLTMRVNGDRVDVAVRPNRTLLEVLRYDLDLFATKQGCDKGDCGACTVRVGGEPIGGGTGWGRRLPGRRRRLGRRYH